MTPEPPILSLVIPARNEAAILEDTLRVVLPALRELEPRSEVIVGDSGSTDGTGDRVRELGLPGVRVVRADLPGKGRILSRALAEARGGIVGFLDADLEIPVGTLAPLLARVRQGADAAVAAKTPETDRERPRLRRFVSRTYNAVVGLLFGSRLPDHQAGCKLFRADALAPV
ncbi:MAG: glycosyltransferase family 2 protein, partial [Longimicrobiales bacterium]|nr:glycosyltransferase family 2 protein [Longimicrobiales bacterium]